jgi:hypothetical protein
VRTYTNSELQSQKMLASTVQFSTYNQTPTRLHRQTCPNPTGRAAVRQKIGPAETKRTPVPRTARSLRTQQRAYEPEPAIQTPLHAHPERHAVLGARDAGRPNWSVFHPRALSRTPADTR